MIRYWGWGKHSYHNQKSFTPTGDEKIDRLNYAKAKEAYKLSQPTQSTSSLLSEEEMKAARAARQKNQLTPIIK